MDKSAKHKITAALAAVMMAACAVTSMASSGAQAVDAARNSGPGSQAAIEAAEAEAEAQKEAEETDLRHTITNKALECMGARYVWGGESPTSGMDCSGLTKYVLKSTLGLDVPHSAAAQANLGTRVSVDELRPGDLVFYTFEGARIDHVAMYLGDGYVIHTSATKHKVVISDIYMGTSPTACVTLLP